MGLILLQRYRSEGFKASRFKVALRVSPVRTVAHAPLENSLVAHDWIRLSERAVLHACA